MGHYNKINGSNTIKEKKGDEPQTNLLSVIFLCLKKIIWASLIFTSVGERKFRKKIIIFNCENNVQ